MLASLFHFLTVFSLVPADDPVPLSPSLLDKYGPGGAIATVALAFAWAMFQKDQKTLELERQRLKDAQEENKELRRDLAELNRITRDVTTPALTQATSAISEAMYILRRDHPRA